MQRNRQWTEMKSLLFTEELFWCCQHKKKLSCKKQLLHISQAWHPVRAKWKTGLSCSSSHCEKTRLVDFQIFFLKEENTFLQSRHYNILTHGAPIRFKLSKHIFLYCIRLIFTWWKVIVQVSEAENEFISTVVRSRCMRKKCFKLKRQQEWM